MLAQIFVEPLDALSLGCVHSLFIGISTPVASSCEAMYLIIVSLNFMRSFGTCLQGVDQGGARLRIHHAVLSGDA